jgi:Tol biopolymer transport system component
MRRILCWCVPLLPSLLAAQTIGDPELFAPGVVSTGNDYTHSLSMTPDDNRVYFTRQVGRVGPFIFMSDYKDRAWQPAVLAPFNGAYGGDYQTLSPDGLRLWFSSRRPANGDTTRAAIRATQSDLFYVDWKNDRWGEPVRLGPPVNTAEMEGYPAPTTSGTIFYHARVAGANRDNVDVWRSVMVNGAYQTPAPLPINFDGLEGEPAPDPAELWLIYMSLRPGGKGDCDLWVTYPTATGWSAPENLEGSVNTEACEWTPKLSPDGGWLFFARISGGGNVSDIYRVKLNTPELARRAQAHR